jgi:hypothetical protein
LRLSPCLELSRESPKPKGKRNPEKLKRAGGSKWTFSNDLGFYRTCSVAYILFGVVLSSNILDRSVHLDLRKAGS